MPVFVQSDQPSLRRHNGTVIVRADAFRHQMVAFCLIVRKLCQRAAVMHREETLSH